MNICVYLVKRSLSKEREREELGAVETKVVMPVKIAPCKYCLPRLNISMKKDFDTDVLFN